MMIPAEIYVLLAGPASPAPNVDDMTSANVTPGLPGFFVFFGMALLLVLLVIDMSKRIRRSTARENVRTRLDAERLALEAEDAARAQQASEPDTYPGKPGEKPAV